MSKSMTRISAVMLAVMTFLSSIFVVPANAATGDKVTISFNYCYDTNGNLIKYQQTTVNDGYTVGSAGDELLITYVDGREVYCIQPGHALYAGDQLTEGSSSAWNSLGTAKQNTINLALMCGKPGSGSALPGNSDEKWAATQLIVWEIVSGCRETSGSYNCTNTKYINGITAGGANSGVKTAYNQIVSNMQTLRKIPSFAADSTGNAKTYEMNASGSSYSLTLTDSNSVLSKFDFKSIGGVTVSKSGNKLTLTAKSPINSAVTLSASRSVSGASASLIAYGDSGLQDVVSGASGITVSAYFKIKATPGSLKLVKTSEDGKVSGIEFTVKGTNYNKNVKTNSKGEFTLSDLVPSTYTVTEKVDERYEAQPPKTVTVEANKTATVKFKNTLRTGGLQIIKTSDDGIIADIEFTVTGANYNKTAKSDKNGEIHLADLIPGTYTVTEKADARYEAQAPQTVTVEADKTATVKFNNTLRKGGLQIIKTSDDGIVADIEFTVTGKDYNKTAKSDESGEILLRDLTPGTYTVTEKVDERYEAQAPKTVTVEADKTATVKFKNILKKWSVKIVKKDSETGKAILYAGAEFQIHYPNDSLVSMNGLDIFSTDDNGSITTPEPLPYGKGYYLVEIKAPYGYVLDSTPVYFDVTDESTTEEKGVTLIKTEKSNPPQMGRITIEKFGEIFVDVISSDNAPEEITDSDMIKSFRAVYESVPTEDIKPITYQPVYSVTGLAGAVFEVYAAEDIITPDGTVRVKKDTLVATLTTDESGKAVSKKLYLGKYRIVEIKAPYGMLLNGEPKIVELTYAGQNKNITTVAAEFHNDRQKVKIDPQKIMGIDERFNLGLNDEILNVSFGLFADEDIIAASGRMIPKDGLIEIIGCDENGFAEFRADLPFGSYYVQELTTDEHYILSDTKYPIVFEYAGQEIDTVHIKANNGEPIINELISGTVKGLKIDRETEETIEGAVFGLFGSDEIVYSENTAILTATSDENGIFTFESVPYGKYIVHEIQSAPGYMANNNNYPVTISENEELIEITAVNDRYPEIRTTAMIEGKKEVGATDVFTLEDTVEYKHLIPGKEYTIKGILMDKATNSPILSDGKEVTSEVVFTPEQANGVVIVSFDFNAALITEETDIVVFETLYHNNTKLAVHADIEDEDQTVRIRLPKIKTKANIEGKKEITTDKPVTITDFVSFENLTVGKEYKLVGVLMDKATGKPFTVDGKEIIAEIIFTAENGEIKVEFTFDGGIITKDTELVVFETLYRGDNEIAVHADINDKDQTVIIRPVPAVPSLPVIPPVTVSVPKTGDDTNLSLWLSIGAVAVGAVISFLIIRFRRKDEDDDE